MSGSSSGGDSSGDSPGPVAPAAGGGVRGVTGVEFHVADFERSLAWYEALGFRVVRRWKDWARLDRDGADLVLQGDAYVRGKDHYFTPNMDGPRGVGVEVVVEVADVDEVYAAAKAAGHRIVKDMQDRPWGARDFRLADPDGYFIRITSPLEGR